MDVTLQRHCAKYIYTVPEGLRELMSDISREVLRSQPEELYTFIADYLDALMITRENARVAAKVVESITEMGATIAELFIKTGMSRSEADQVADIIQGAFKKHLSEKRAQQISDAVEEANIITEIINAAGITPEQAEQSAIIIQNAYRNFKQRQQRERDLLKGMVDWRVAARSTLRLYRLTGVTYEEANRAATLIKAAYKGYYTRRLIKRLVAESERLSEEYHGEDINISDYYSYWDRHGYETEPEFYKDLEEIRMLEDEEEHEHVEIEETGQTIALGIVDSLIRHAVPDSISDEEVSEVSALSTTYSVKEGDAQIEMVADEAPTSTSELESSALETANTELETIVPVKETPTDASAVEDDVSAAAADASAAETDVTSEYTADTLSTDIPHPATEENISEVENG